jgi:hypothetical protein
MPSYTLEYDGTTKTFEAWGLEGLNLRWAAFEAGVASFTSVGQAADAAPLFAHEAAGIIRLGDDVILSGLFGQVRRVARGQVEVVSYVLRDAFHDMDARFYSGAAWAFPALSNTVDTMYELVIDAAATAGVAIQFGTAANLDVGVPALEFRDQTFGSMLRSLRQIVPDVSHYLDHSTTPPTIHFVRRADAEALTLTPLGEWDGIEIEALHDIQSAGVVIQYVKQIDNGSGPAETKYTDIYPEGAVAGARRVVVATFDLRGNQVETQPLSVTNINGLSKAWWAARFPWVNEATGSGFTIADTTRKIMNGEGEWVDDTTGSTHEIIDGGVPSWKSEAQTVLVTANAENFTLHGKTYASVPLQVTIHATSLSGGLYVNETDPGEDPPAGLAQAYFEATSVLHHAGTLDRVVDELSTPLVHCGKVLNFAGGNSTARGWDVMRAVISGIEINVDSAAVKITFGPPAHLALQDILAMSKLRGAQGREVVTRGSEGGGVRRTASNNSVPSLAEGSAATPWTILESGAVVPGTINGAAPFIGSTDRIDEVPPPVLSISGNKRAYLKLSWTITKNNGRIATADWLKSEVGVVAGDTPPANVIGDTEVTAYVLLAVITDGVPGSSYYSKAALSATFCDTSDSAVTVTIT